MAFINPHIIQRMKSLLSMCQAIDQGGRTLSTASMGTEREFFINTVLSNIISPPFRIGSGDITDFAGNRSGQCDIIIEYGSSISFPMVSPDAPRLYLAEGVCAVIEIKSDLSGQWGQVLSSHERLAPLKRKYLYAVAIGKPIPDIEKRIPHFIVGYRGWKKEQSLKEKIEQSGVDGILCIDSGIYLGKDGTYGENASSLFAFLIQLQQHMSSMVISMPDYKQYIDQD